MCTAAVAAFQLSCDCSLIFAAALAILFHRCACCLTLTLRTCASHMIESAVRESAGRADGKSAAPKSAHRRRSLSVREMKSLKRVELLDCFQQTNFLSLRVKPSKEGNRSHTTPAVGETIALRRSGKK